MSAARLLLAALPLAPCLWPEGPRGIGAPSYSTDSIVNAASQRAGALAPNTIATLYGVDLAYSTRALQPADLSAGAIPMVLDGVRVNLGGLYSPLLFVSPGQINFVVPYLLVAGELDLYVERDNTRGPKVRIRLEEAAPALFATESTILATHADGRLLSAEAPGVPGEVVVLYSTGLGRTEPDQAPGRLAVTADRIRRLDELRVLLDEEPVSRILYCGVTPGFAGLYQINLELPETIGKNPELRIVLGDQGSPAGYRLPVR
ncbi:MAG: hypothetical protein HYR60_03845 [Acidobacteria bacterium]|nr:hypothetical protein [Acidobacteriota bacterium]MBI3470267.1 hypothetical protein [Candidatus Solibacter usitatus]